MRSYITASFLTLAVMAFVSCGESAYDKKSETDEMVTTDTGSGFQTGAGTESIADPNAANTKRTPVPLDTVVVDTINSENNR